MGTPRKEAECLVIGTGIAGATCALMAARMGIRVCLITKRSDIFATNTNRAQGGIVYRGNGDTVEMLVADIIRAGRGINSAEAVEFLAEKGPDVVKEVLIDDLKVDFTHLTGAQDEDFDLTREGAHSVNRILYSADNTGEVIEKALIRAVKGHPNVEVLTEATAIDLITLHHHSNDIQASYQLDNRCLGAYVFLNRKKEVIPILAQYTVLATGGLGDIYLHTTNEKGTVGDGMVMAQRAGARMINMEFMQFHPTSLYHPEANSFLISEAVRGFGGRLIHKDGESFMEKYHPMAALAPRDIVARAIDTELKKRGVACVFLDVSHLDADAVRNRFPNIYENCLRYKIDITKEPIPVVPAAHYACGGVKTDLKGRSSIAGLFACGEVTCTGVHGANRLASNSLLEAVVFAHEASQAAIQFAARRDKIPYPIPQWDDSGTFNQEEWVLISHDRLEIQNIMWDYVGIVRSNARLERALTRIRLIRQEIENYYKRTRVSESLLELRNLATVAQLIIQSAMLRKESRGLHYTTDYPKRDDDAFLHDTLIDRSGV